MKIISLLLIFSLISTSFAHGKDSVWQANSKTDFEMMVEAGTPDCKKKVQYLSYGQKTPCTGFLFSPEHEYNVRFKIATFDNLQKYIKKQEEINKILNERLVNAQKHNINLSDRLQKKENNSFWHKTLYFILGAILTGAIAKNVR